MQEITRRLRAELESTGLSIYERADIARVLSADYEAMADEHERGGGLARTVKAPDGRTAL